MDPRDLPQMPNLMIAGPGELHDEDLDLLGRQLIAHYGDVWVELHNETLDRLAELLGSTERPYLVPGTGTTCLDAAVMNLFEPGETVVVAQTGFFGTRLVEVSNAHRLQVVEVAVPIGEPVDPAALGQAARAHGAAGVLLTHVETSTGVRHPIEEAARAAHEAGAIVMVDGIASVGAERCSVDGMDLDAVVTGTQKGLESMPGLGILALGPRGRARVDGRREPVPSWYLDLKRWDWYRENWEWHPHPVTFPTNPTMALLSSMNRILSEGLDRWVERRAALASACREGLERLGFEPVARADVQSNMVVAAYAEDAAALLPAVLADGIQISGGLAPLAGRTIRIGLMGRSASEAMVARVLDSIERARKGQ